MTTHAITNAQSVYETITAYWEAVDFLHYPTADESDFAELSADALEVLSDVAGIKCFDDISRNDADTVEDAASELALSVCVRSGWTAVGDAMEPEEFEILLTTGGPGCRIVGDLNGGEPCRAELQHQDWGTPWTRLPGQQCDALNWFAGLFYFGG